MPEKKPVPPPAPRNRRERRKRATEERRARPWLPRPMPFLDGQWTTFAPGRKPTFYIGDYHAGMKVPPITLAPDDRAEIPGDVHDGGVPSEGDVVPPTDGPAYRQAAFGSGIVARPTGGFTRPTAPADPPPATFDREP